MSDHLTIEVQPMLVDNMGDTINVSKVRYRRKKSLKQAFSSSNNTHQATNLSLSSRYTKPANSLTLLFLSCSFVSFIVGVLLVAIVELNKHMVQYALHGVMLLALSSRDRICVILIDLPKITHFLDFWVNVVIGMIGGI